MSTATQAPLEKFFTGFGPSRLIFDTLIQHVDSWGPCSTRITKTQIVLSRRSPFAWVWIPEKHLGRTGAPLVLSINFAAKDDSPRWKQITQVSASRWMHHLELFTPGDIDGQALCWLRNVWDAAA